MSAIQKIFRIYGKQYLELYGDRMPWIYKKVIKDICAEVALLEPFFMLAMTVKPYSPFPVAAETGIVPPVSRVKRINGCINKWTTSCLPIISF